MILADKLKARIAEPVNKIGNLAILALAVAVLALLVAVSHAR